MTVEPASWQLLGQPRLDALSELLHENTKISPAARGFVISAEALEVMRSGYKTYEFAGTHELPPPSARLSMPVGDAMRHRWSARRFAGPPMSAADLGDLLFHGYGEKHGAEVRRLAPSAGALFPLELYPIVLGVDGVPRGVFHYDVRGHRLERVDPVVDAGLLGRSVFVDGLLDGAGVVIAVSAVFGRTKIKYGERGYRFALMEAGHVAQNILLAATALGLGSCPVGGFVDDHVNRILDVDGLDEAALYLIVAGPVGDDR